MSENYTADPRFQAWSDSAFRSFGSNLDAALGVARTDALERRGVFTGSAYALMARIYAGEPVADACGASRAERAMEIWLTLGASYLAQVEGAVHRNDERGAGHTRSERP